LLYERKLQETEKKKDKKKEERDRERKKKKRVDISIPFSPDIELKNMYQGFCAYLISFFIKKKMKENYKYTSIIFGCFNSCKNFISRNADTSMPSLN